MQMNKKPHVKPYGAGGKSQDNFHQLFSPMPFASDYHTARSYGLELNN